MTKFVALDVGNARIGLAFAELTNDQDLPMVFGRGFIHRKSLTDDILQIKDLMTQENADMLIVGLPKRRDNQDSAQTQNIRAFSDALVQAGIAIDYEDERYTSKLAQSKLLSSGLSKKKRRKKGLVDEAAAILILESYLERRLAKKRVHG